MSDFKENGIEDNRDWTIQDMLKESLEYVEKEDRNHPTGLRGAIVVFFHSEDRIDLQESSDKDEDQYRLYYMSGIDCIQAAKLLEEAKMLVHRTHFINVIKGMKEDGEI